MAEPYLGQIYLVGYDFAQRGFAFCDGQLLPISSNSALFSLLGTMYGGDGRTTFALPDLRGRVAMGRGHGPGLSVRTMGQRGGSETNTLTVAELPSHNHSPTLHAELNPPGSPSPSGNMLSLTNIYAAVDSAEDTQLATNAIRSSNVGGNLPVNNLQPYLVLNYEIALQGIFPSRS
ncbi:phage tail protein [Nioella ostreopsis]|jgi:microcystin-dependent protein|uniref:phage tail protein n=1 Tax=Nioella ostreopsis TaxID=2448479 RepID=UPI000FDC87C1|nr:tail fiber protein [Nioella ostreopsis]